MATIDKRTADTPPPIPPQDIAELEKTIQNVTVHGSAVTAVQYGQ